jgi:hypothetical protein
VFNTRTFPATNYAGKYTMVIQRTNDDASLPAGDGYGTVNVNTAGKIKLSGSLADGTALSQSTTVSKDGQWPFYASLYGGKGSALSWITFTNLDGRFSWIKPALPTARFYRAGFTNAEFVAKGSRYTQPGRTNRVMELTDGTNGIVTFTGGELPDFTNHVTLGTANRVVNTSSNRLTLTIARSSGAFNGTVAPPGATRRIPFKGVLLQNHNHGSGYFLGTNQTGRVYFGPE